MGDVASLLLTGGVVSLGCVHSWRYLRRVRQAGADDRAARERALAHYRQGAGAPPHQDRADVTDA